MEDVPSNIFDVAQADFNPPWFLIQMHLLFSKKKKKKLVPLFFLGNEY